MHTEGLVMQRDIGLYTCTTKNVLLPETMAKGASNSRKCMDNILGMPCTCMYHTEGLVMQRDRTHERTRAQLRMSC